MDDRTREIADLAQQIHRVLHQLRAKHSAYSFAFTPEVSDGRSCFDKLTIIVRNASPETRRRLTSAHPIELQSFELFMARIMALAFGYGTAFNDVAADVDSQWYAGLLRDLAVLADAVLPVAPSESNSVDIEEPTRPVSLSAASSWFQMNARTLKSAIEQGRIKAKQLSAQRWVFELSEVPADRHREADPELTRSRTRA